MNLKQARAWTTAQLASASNSPRLDADCLICFVAAIERPRLYSHADDVLDNAQIQALQDLVKQRQLGVPVAYLTGTQEFWSMPFAVNPNVLIPRADTELLVELCLARIPHNATARVLELGTGSGAIAVAIAHERPHCTVIATDISHAALNVARENARTNNVQHIEFIESDWYNGLSDFTSCAAPFDVIVSNPPYIAQGDNDLCEHVAGHEPATALYASDHGLAAIREVISGATRHLKPGGALFIEHGWRQGDEVRSAFEKHGFDAVSQGKDLAGLVRVTTGSRFLASVFPQAKDKQSG